MKKLIAIAALSAAASIATPASAAVSFCSPGPVSNFSTDGCVASGNDNLASVENALAAALGVNVSSLDLSLYGKSDDNPALFTFSSPQVGGGFNVKSVDWSVIDGTLIKYVTVKGANSFKLYEIAGAGASSGVDFSTLGILNGGGNQPDISHLSFWTVPGTTAVPEPATWAMMIAGFGFAGGLMRRRAAKVSFA